MQKGEVWIVELPNIGGHEQHGIRPVIILADTTASVALVIPCTSNIQALRFPHTVRLEPTQQNGLTMPTIALVLQLRAIDKTRLQQKIGTLEKSDLEHLYTSVRSLLAY